MLEFTRITQDPAVLGGRPCIRHLHVTAATILSLIAAGRTPVDILEAYPELRMEDLREALRFAAWRIEEPEAMLPPVGKLERSQAPAPARASSASPTLAVEAKSPELAKPEEEEPSPTDLRENRPCLIVTRVGIFDRRLGVGIIAWRDIHHISIGKNQGRESICLEVVKPQRYLQRLPQIQRGRANFQMFFRTAPLCITVAGTGLSAVDLELRIKRIWVIFRNDSWRALKNVPAFEDLDEEPADIQPLPPDEAMSAAGETPTAQPPTAEMLAFPEEFARELIWEAPPPKEKNPDDAKPGA